MAQNGGVLETCCRMLRPLLSRTAVLQILLGFVIAEIVGLLTALVLRCCVDPDGHYGMRCSRTLTFPFR